MNPESHLPSEDGANRSLSPWRSAVPSSLVMHARSYLQNRASQDCCESSPLAEGYIDNGPDQIHNSSSIGAFEAWPL